MSTDPSQPYICYGIEASYFVGKVRSYLRKKGINFDERLTSHPHFNKSIIKKVGFNTMPVIETPDGEVVQDTTEIIDFFEARYPENSVYPSGPKQRMVALLLEMYADEFMLKPGTYYRWFFPEDNREWMITQFSYAMVAEDGRFFDHDARENAMEMSEKAIDFMPPSLKGIGVSAETGPAIEANFEEFLDLCEIHFKQYPYLLGGKPSIGDFGLIAPFHGHLCRDIYPTNLVKHRAPHLYRWSERMNVADASMAEFPDMTRDFLPDDEIPETLLPILKLIAKDYMPEVESILSFMKGWLDERPDFPAGEPINPAGVLLLGAFEGIGEHTVDLRGTPITQNVRYYSQWMFQRLLDHRDSLSSDDLADVDTLFESTGLLHFLKLKVARRMARVDNKEVFV